jgi:hypothetical protein
MRAGADGRGNFDEKSTVGERMPRLFGTVLRSCERELVSWRVNTLANEPPAPRFSANCGAQMARYHMRARVFNESQPA